MFSNDQVAGFINQNFEAVWQSVRPVPLVRIDFGNGNVLTRTLHGNVVSLVCDAEGRLLDALPGIYRPDEYLGQLGQLRLLARYVSRLPSTVKDDRVRGYHCRAADAISRGQTPEQFALRARVAPMTKAIVESSLEVVLQPASPWQPNNPPTMKTAGSLKLESAEDVATWKSLSEDTELNETTRRRQIHEILAGTGMVLPDKVSRRFYKEVLHADLDDPYLGLGPTLFGTYPFAREDGGG